jgi:hypothetical protein
LLIFPLLAEGAGIAYLGVLWASLLSLDAGFTLGQLSGALSGDLSPMGYGVLFAFYFGTSFLTAYFSSALLYSTRQAFRGDAPSLRAGLRAPLSNLWPLLVWGLISATVGVLLRAAEETDQPIVEGLAGMFSLGWTIVTYFVVPVITFEERSIGDMFTRSAEVLVDAWGEALGAYAHVSLVTFLYVILLGIVGLVVAVPAIAYLGMRVTWAPAVVIAFGMFGLLIGKTLDQVVKAAAYQYATDGQLPGTFTEADFESK